AGPLKARLPRGKTPQAGLSQACSQGSLTEAKTPGPAERLRPVRAGRPTGEDLNLREWYAGGAYYGDLAPQSLRTLESAKGSDGLLVVHGRVQGYDHLFRILIDSGASRNFARRRTVARNSNRLTDALRESKGNGAVSVRLADGKAVTVPNIQMDLAVKFEDFDSLEQFTVLDMDPYDMILGMPWLEKHEPWIDWRGKAFGASRPAVTDRALVSHVPTSDRSWGARKGRQVTETSSGCLGVVNGYDESKVATQAGVRQTVAQTLTEDEDAGCASCVGNIVPHEDTRASDVRITTSEDVGNEVPRHGRRRRRHRRRKSSLNHVQTGVVHNDSEPRARALSTPSVEGCYHVLDGETEVAELLNLEEMTAESFLANLKAGEIAEFVLIKQETSQDPVYPLVSEYADVVTKNLPSQLPPDREVQHEMDLVPGTKYCVMRQWPLPGEQCEVIDAFFAAKAKVGMVRESKSPHSTPTFCVRKPNGKWRLVHAFNKQNSAWVPAQTPIPRKD
ncbi:hypothetical protein F442_06179, partial [Phytophthora nicotianae P10297]